MDLVRFVLRRALFEISASKQRSFLVVMCVAVGLSSIVAMQVYTSSMANYFSSNVKEVVGGDIQISRRGDWDQAKQDYLESRRARGDFDYTAISQTQGTASSKTDPNRFALVQIKIVDPSKYPFYGSIEVRGVGDGRQILAKGQAIINTVAMDSLGAQVGDEIQINGIDYVIGDVLVRDPSSDPFSSQIMGTILVADDERARQLVDFGPAMFVLKLKSDSMLDEISREMKDLFGEKAVTTYLEMSQQVDSASHKLSQFLLVVGLSSLLLGGLGVSSAVNMMVRQKLKDMAVVKCFGGRTIHLAMIFVVQVLILALIGSALGIASGILLSQAIPQVLSDLVNLRPGIHVRPGMLLEVAGLGLLVAVVFSVIPVLEVARVKPLAAIRQDMEIALTKRKEATRNVLTAIGVAGIFAIVLSLILGSLKVGFFVSYVALLLICILYMAVLLVVNVVLTFMRMRTPAALLAYRNLGRDKSKAVSSILAISLGVGAIVLVTLLQHNVVGTIRESLNDAKSFNVVVMSIGAMQGTEIKSYLDSAPYVEATGYVRAVQTKVIAIDGRMLEVNAGAQAGARLGDLTDPDDKASQLGNLFLAEVDFDQTYLPAKIVSGRYLDQTKPGELLISEKSAKAYGVGVGSKITVSSMGQPYELTVVGIASGESGGIQIGISGENIVSKGTFSSVQSPLSAFSQMTILMLRTKEGYSGSYAVSDIKAKFPKVRMVFDIGMLLDIIYKVLGAMTKFMQFIGLFSVAAGGVLLAGMMVLSKYERRKDIAMVRCLGGDTGTVFRTYIMESGFVGIVSGVLGFLVSTVVVGAITKYGMKTPFGFEPAFFVLTVAVTVSFAVAVGVGSILDIVNERPLAVLKYE